MSLLPLAFPPFSPSMHPELEHGQQDAHHERLPQVLHLRHRQDRQLAEDRQHVVLQQRVTEDLDLGRGLVVSQGAVAEPVSVGKCGKCGNG